MALALVKQKLTDDIVKAMRVPTGKDRAFAWCAALEHFGAMKTAHGSTSYVFQYRIGGKSKRLTIKAANVEAARQQALRFAAELNAGRDPGAGPSAALPGRSLRDLALAYFAQRGDFRSRKEYMQILERDVFPLLGAKTYDQIVTSDLVALKQAIMARVSKTGEPAGHHAAANALKVLRTLWSKYGCEHSRDGYSWPRVVSPTQDLPEENGRPGRDLSPAEIRALWNASEQCGLYGSFFRMLMYTGLRRSACAMLRVEQLMADGVLHIPGSRTKLAYELPLSGPALDLLASVRRDGCPYFFSLDGVGPFQNFVQAKRCLDRHAKLNEPWHLHCARHTFRTLIDDLCDPVTAGLAMGHSRKGMDKVYSHNKRTELVRAAMEALAERLHEITA